MEVLRGVARDLNAAEAVATGGAARVFGTQHGAFAIGRQRIRMIMTGPLRYDEGDELVLAGNLMPDGVFAAFAGQNLTNGSTAFKGGTLGLVISAVVFLICAPLSIVLVGLPFCIVAGGYFTLAWRARTARKMVQRSIAETPAVSARA